MVKYDIVMAYLQVTVVKLQNLTWHTTGFVSSQVL